MFRWFRRRQDVERLAGRTAREWYWLHRRPQYRDASWPTSLAQAVCEITAGGGQQGTPVRLVDVLVTDSSEAARCVAAIQLGIDNPPGAESALVAALQDGSEVVRRTAAESLLSLGSIRGLAAIVAGPCHGHGVRTQAAFKLAKMEPGEAAEAVPSLMVLLQYPHINWRTHWAVVDALRVIGDPAIPAIVNGLHRGSPQVRQYAAHALKEMGRTPDLLPLIDEELRKAGFCREDETETAGH